MTDRTWDHSEGPTGAPSPAGYRNGCRCAECSELYRAYLRAYRANRQHAKRTKEGTPEYHTHAGQPSKRTAVRWTCTHATCLRLAGLALVDGVVVDAATMVPHSHFAAAA